MAAKKDVKEWTLMFYFAGDNDLAPVIVSQLKEIKDAGYHKHIDVLVHFDANALGVPTRVYDVNRARKNAPKSPPFLIGDCGDSFVRDMLEDEVMPDKIKAVKDRPASTALKNALKTPDEIKADEALKNFIGYCRENHQAKRYMLFLVGHGMIVGNDAFLSDENPVSAITLTTLGEILKDFADDVRYDGDSFELLTLHSCSMSAIEVAYELKDTANYMMGSEGPSFVGTWPYRQLLKRIFNHLKTAEESEGAEKEGGARDGKSRIPRIDAPFLIGRLFYLTLFNSVDFLLAGYSQDLALCNLNSIGGLTAPMRKLVAMLKRGLKASRGDEGLGTTERGKRIKELVLLAHWEAQSYWEESYTDLFDFCHCLREGCNSKDELEDLRDACLNVMKSLQGIVFSRHFGSMSQYSHGLSVYFPWSRPRPVEGIASVKKKTQKPTDEKPKDQSKGIMERYKKYAFTTRLVGESWFSFLESYFDKTRRQSRTEENHMNGGRKQKKSATVSLPMVSVLSGARLATSLGNPEGKPTPLLGVGDGKPTPLLSSDDGKPTPVVGVGCGCPSIKNYSEDKESDAIPGKRRIRR